MFTKLQRIKGKVNLIRKKKLIFKKGQESQIQVAFQQLIP